MFNSSKIFLKIGFILSAIIAIYVVSIVSILSPKITSYMVELESNQAKAQLDKVLSILNSKEKYLKEFRSQKEVEHRNNIRNASFSAYSIMNNYYQMYKDGKLSKEEALNYTFETISKINYGYEDDYIYVLDRTGTLVFHPDKKYHKQNIYYTTDANGKLFVGDIIDNSVKLGETYTRYSWTKLNSNFVSEKIVHSIYFEPLDLIISSGVYIENIKQELKVEMEKTIVELKPLVESIVDGYSGYIYIVNSNNEVLLHPNEKLVNTNISALKHPVSSKNVMESLIEAYNTNGIWEYTWNRPNDLKNYTYKKIAWIEFNPFFDWYVVSSTYEDDLMIKSNNINEIIIYVSTVILFVLVLIAMFIIKKLLQPITVLSDNAKLVKNGNLTVRNKIKTRDEIGILSEHFDSMLDSIEENTKELEHKVELRTAELKHKLYYDKLTGLKNRVSLRKDLKGEDFCALNLIDLEGLDDINELYGFSVGNEILIEVMKLLKEFCKETETSLYRLDTGNFAILDNKMQRFISYDSFLDDIQNILKKEISIKSLGIEIFVYVTVGTSISQTEPLKSANIALKRAKQNGVKYLVYNKSIDTRDNIKKSMYWREKIKEAIEEDRVVPFFQAIFNRDEEIVKYETLMRIYDEVDGKPYYLSPGSFFEFAIKTKQYFKLNQIVIKKALDSIDRIGKHVSINIGFSDVMNRGFSQFIEEEIDKLSIEQRKKVVFEIVESDHISDYEILDEFILKYREKGVSIAIDDFGTGYSNFSHILKIKPNYIKIDGSLIKDINKDENSYELVKSIVEFSNSLEIKVIAEFIHSKEVYDIVKELGIDEFQGYFLGEPEPLMS